MPTYRYECDACGHALELFQSMTERPKRKCPDCGRPKLQRLIGAGAGVIFRGSGFYETDYRKESYKAAEKAATGSESKPSGDGASSGGSGSDAGSGGSAPASSGSAKKTGSKKS